MEQNEKCSSGLHCNDCNNCPQTITVAGYFGKDKQLTKQEFSDIWCKHVLELRRLDYSTEWQQKCDQMVSDTRDKCHEEFDRIYKTQNLKAS